MLNSGIYCIENIYNGKMYIGSSFNIRNRLNTHFSLLRRDKSHNKHLQAAYNKYGKDAFISYIIEFCERNKVKEREQFWLDQTSCLISGYNKSSSVVDNSGWHHTQELKDRLSKERTGSGNPIYGKKMSAKEIEIVRKNSTGRKHSIAAIEKMKSQRKLNAKNYIGSKSGKSILTEEKVYLIKLKILEKIPYPKIAKEFNVSPITIGGIAKNRRWRHVQLKTA